MQHLTVSEIARRLGARPRDISDLFYRRQLSDERCPIIGGRRLIPESYVTAIAAALRRAGRPIGELSSPANRDGNHSASPDSVSVARPSHDRQVNSIDLEGDVE
jgi:hypothetical protein